MGNRHSTQHAGRRRSLAPEDFIFADPALEWDGDWEVYRLDIELKPLSAHAARGVTHVCVDDYTQEILSGEEVCLCACASSLDEAGNWWSLAESDEDSSCGNLQNESDGEFCIQWDVDPDELGMLDIGQIATYDLDTGIRLEENMVPFDVNDSERVYIEGDSRLDGARDEGDTEVNVTRCAAMEKHGAQSIPTTHNESTSPRNIVEGIQFREGLVSSNTSAMTASLNEQQKTGLDSDIIRGQRDQRFSSTSLETGLGAMTSEAICDQGQKEMPSCSDGKRPQTTSCSIPVPQVHTAINHLTSPAVSKKRKFSLKDDPGWIPNPLDSDSEEGDDFEDSGIFSDFTGSPSSLSAVYVPSTPRAPSRPCPVVRTRRRRCYSEPMSGTFTTSASPTQLETGAGLHNPPTESGTTPRTRNGSGSSWRLLRFSRRGSGPTRATDVPGQAEEEEEEEGSRSPQDEDDLSEQLKWLMMTDSQSSQDLTESSSDPGEEGEKEDAESSSEISPNTEVTCPRESQFSQSAGELADGESRFDGELELDWLCEPEWNNLELELFWSMLRPHLEHLLEPEDSELLPEACGAVCRTDAADPKMLDRCLLHVQWHIWKGSYRQAVSDFRAIRRHFLCCAQSQLIESGTRDDVENLRLLFQRKRPSRFRLWI